MVVWIKAVQLLCQRRLQDRGLFSFIKTPHVTFPKCTIKEKRKNEFLAWGVLKYFWRELTSGDKSRHVETGLILRILALPNWSEGYSQATRIASARTDSKSRNRRAYCEMVALNSRVDRPCSEFSWSTTRHTHVARKRSRKQTGKLAAIFAKKTSWSSIRGANLKRAHLCVRVVTFRPFTSSGYATSAIRSAIQVEISTLIDAEMSTDSGLLRARATAFKCRLPARF